MSFITIYINPKLFYYFFYCRRQSTLNSIQSHLLKLLIYEKNDTAWLLKIYNKFFNIMIYVWNFTYLLKLDH